MARKKNWVGTTAGLAACVLFASACGDDGGGDDAAPPTTDPPAASTTVADTPESTTSAPSESTTTTEAPTTTTAVPVATLAPDEIPELVARWDDGTGDSLELARNIIGFPIDVAPASDGGPFWLEVDMDATDPAEPWTWDWFYEARAADPIDEIDIALDDNGAGAVALREHYTAVMADLGWTYSNSTGSDPSSGGGGPQSINDVYQSDTGTLMIAGVEAETNPMFVWADEDLGFDNDPQIPGYRIGLSLDVPADAIVVPLLETLAADIPELPGARLVDMGLRTLERDADSFLADYGLRYLEIDFGFELPDGSAEAAQSAVLGALPQGIYQIGEESFFEPGTLEVNDPIVSGDRWTQNIVVLDRYEGSIQIESDPVTGAATARVQMLLEPLRSVLTAAEE